MFLHLVVATMLLKINYIIYWFMLVFQMDANAHPVYSEYYSTPLKHRLENQPQNF